jgi:hypothetical protein
VIWRLKEIIVFKTKRQFKTLTDKTVLWSGKAVELPIAYR